MPQETLERVRTITRERLRIVKAKAVALTEDVDDVTAGIDDDQPDCSELETLVEALRNLLADAQTALDTAEIDLEEWLMA